MLRHSGDDGRGGAKPKGRRSGRPRRVLEARFHPYRKDDHRYVVAGWVIFEGEYPPLVLAASPATDSVSVAESRALLLKVRYLVDIAAAASLPALRDLRSSFWSFIDVPESQASTRRADGDRVFPERTTPREDGGTPPGLPSVERAR